MFRKKELYLRADIRGYIGVLHENVTLHMGVVYLVLKGEGF
jgi:hypothetical protein